MATKESHRVSKLQEILNLFAEIGLDIVEETPNDLDDAEYHKIQFAGLSKENKVAKILTILKRELTSRGSSFSQKQITKLKSKLSNTSVHNIKIIRSRLIHIRKQTWFELTQNSDTEFVPI